MIEQLALVGAPQVSLEDDFLDWWAGYPVKRDKKPARRAYVAQRRKGATAEELVRARDAYLAQATVPYVKYPATFLGVWDEWLPALPSKSVTPSIHSNSVNICGGCGSWDRYCMCGQKLHRPTRKPRSEGGQRL